MIFSKKPIKLKPGILTESEVILFGSKFFITIKETVDNKYLFLIFASVKNREKLIIYSTNTYELMRDAISEAMKELLNLTATEIEEFRKF